MAMRLSGVYSLFETVRARWDDMPHLCFLKLIAEDNFSRISQARTLKCA